MELINHWTPTGDQTLTTIWLDRVAFELKRFSSYFRVVPA